MSTTSAAQILNSVGPGCRDGLRRQLLLQQTLLAGIDFVEYEELAVAPPVPAPPPTIATSTHVLHVHFLNTVPSGASALPANLGVIKVHGGTRTTGIDVVGARPGATASVVDVYVDSQGDFSPYLLSIGWHRDAEGIWRFDFDDVDRLFSVAPVNFRPGCPVEFDCAPLCDCPEDELDEPALDYLARDYASFRQLLLDLVAQRNPSWTERSPADVGIALLELFAYEGDNISYFQDAVANEAYLDTARQRVSAKRHAKLVDYEMHDGRNAWTFAHFNVSSRGTIPPGQQLVTHITSPMRFNRVPGMTPVPQPTSPPGAHLHFVSDGDYRTDPALAQARVFETAAAVVVDPLNNELRLHTWGNEECCLPRGATTAHVYAIKRPPQPPPPALPVAATAVRPPLRAGDYLVFEEVVGPKSGAAADADPTHRQVVQIVSVDPTPPSSAAVGIHDRLFLAKLAPGTDDLVRITAPTVLADTLPLVEVTWRTVDALSSAFFLSDKADDGTPVHGISVARGNLALADHGRTVVALDDNGMRTWEVKQYSPPLNGAPTFRLRLDQGPLTMQGQPDADPTSFPPVRDRRELGCDVRRAKPAVAIEVKSSIGGTDAWWPVPDLLSSTEFQHHFVTDVDDQGRAVLRFGDGQYGRRLLDTAEIAIWYRVGNGRAGNVGADSLVHVVVPDVPPFNWPTIEAVRNPLPARGGEDAELIEQVRQHAPAAFRARQLRAVTERDYENAARASEEVAGAVASFRWTGSWYTAFVGIDPVDGDNLITDARGIARLEPSFKQRVLDALTRYRLAGYDLEIRSARYVPVDVAIQICAKAGYFAGDIARAVALALSSGSGRAGGGLFDPLNLTFGQPVYLSRIYAAAEDVEGVESATVTAFHRHGREPAGELASGRLPIGPWEIARVDNDRNNMENGTLTITVGGGS